MNTALFSRDSLVEAATDAAGTDALDLGAFAEPLDALLASLGEEAGLYPARVWRTLDNLTEELTLRAARKRLLDQHPEIAQIPIERPIFVVGLPRTGTTLLHNLLARTPGLRAWKLWELRNPVRDERADAQVIADTQGVVEALYGRVPAFRAIHPLHAEWPDECSWLMRHAFSSLVWSLQYHVPGYRDWMCTHDQSAAYADFKLWLQVLRARDPGGRLVLKDPCHLWHLDALLSTFPDATIVHLHRDPAEAIPSLASLCHTLHGMDSSITNPRQSGAEVLALAEAGKRAVAAARQRWPESRLLDLSYRTLVSDPLASLRDLLATLGHDAPDLDPPRRWLTENRQHSAGRHQYSAEMFGFRAEDLRERFAEL